ncbi:hypothetical protein [Teredinibacter haidensis]|uniref:hypothetical protein n=1 Tax=Teredinibacter haidensis TaxID=2731755 RepID=UPI0009490BB3|nr:hypothetical protein [Teredinibacter haidensis]
MADGTTDVGRYFKPQKEFHHTDLADQSFIYVPELNHPPQIYHDIYWQDMPMEVKAASIVVVSMDVYFDPDTGPEALLVEIIWEVDAEEITAARGKVPL